jgi:hypothetical protein
VSSFSISKISHIQISIILAWLILCKEYGLRGRLGGYFGAVPIIAPKVLVQETGTAQVRSFINS